MKHISENKRNIGKKDYYVTDDPDIIKALWTTSEEIHIDKLQKQIADIEEQIAAIPDAISTDGLTGPGKALVEEQNAIAAFERPALEEELARLQIILAEVTT